MRQRPWRSWRAGPPQQRFRSGVDAVRVDVLVTDGHRPVGGLTAEDFELTDSGVPQRIEAVGIGGVPLSVMLGLDTSESVWGQPLQHLKEAASAVIGLLTPNDRAAVLTFAGAPQLRTGWTSDRAQLGAAVSARPRDGRHIAARRRVRRADVARRSSGPRPRADLQRRGRHGQLASGTSRHRRRPAQRRRGLQRRAPSRGGPTPRVSRRFPVGRAAERPERPGVPC